MNIDTITQTIAATFPDTYCQEADGDLFFFHGTEEKFPFATIVTKDNDYDNVSQLDREGVFRLNIGIGKATFQSLFAAVPSQPGIGGYMQSGLDFTALDTLLPHPVYGSMYWISILNPGKETMPQLLPYFEEAYLIAVKRSEKTAGKQQ